MVYLVAWWPHHPACPQDAQHPLPTTVGYQGWGTQPSQGAPPLSQLILIILGGVRGGTSFKSVAHCNLHLRAAGGGSAVGCQPSGSLAALEISLGKKKNAISHCRRAAVNHSGDARSSQRRHIWTRWIF